MAAGADMSLSFAVRHAQGQFELDAHLETEKGVTALFGRSGSGKTTIINLIAGLIRPGWGRIAVEGVTLTDTEAGIFVAPHRRRIGYVFQEDRLFPHLNVRRNLQFGEAFVARRLHWAKFDDVVALLGIGQLLDRLPGKLSGGEKQRVAIGRALLTSPRLLLMDEPLASLDPERKAEIIPYLARLHDAMDLPIVYVSHAVDEVARLADQVAVIAGGRVRAFGPASQIFASLDLQHDFGATEAGALLTGIVAAHDAAGGLTIVDHFAGRMRIPAIDARVGSKVRLRVKSRDVAIARGSPQGLSIRNRLTCRVIDIVHERPPYVELKLDAGGEALLALVTGEAVRELKIRRGSSVTALIKAISFQALDG
jgi:molybdate transport system ATP-binding protein